MSIKKCPIFLNSLFFVALLVWVSGCSPSRKMTRTLADVLSNEKLFDDHFSGFVLYDLEADKTIFSQNADRLFTPASNTKLLTLLSALTILPDSLISFSYAPQDDSLFVFGFGDPSTLNPNLGNSKAALDFLDSMGLPTVFCKSHFFSNRFGPGWAWDDYAYGFQVEKTFFPLFGNALHVAYCRTSHSLNMYPNIVSARVYEDDNFRVVRSEHGNDFEVSLPRESADQEWIYPLRLTDSTIESALRNILSIPLRVSSQCPVIKQKQLFHSIPAESAYGVMIKESDNFIAEQLLMMCAGILSDSLSSDIGIQYMLNGLLKGQKLNWRDGSGLSRYNLTSPNALIYVLKEIYHKLGSEGIQRIFPAGGESGTIKNWYSNSPEAPFIYAKTGTLTGVHCLSGYLYSDAGRLLIFSMMHNNYANGSAPIKKEMNQILQLIKQKY